MIDNYVLITGASSGLGLAFAETFSQKGHNVILLARNKTKLQAIANDLRNKYQTKVVFYECDLLEYQEIDYCIERILGDGLQIKILINNAGMSNFGEFSQTTFDDEGKIMQLNMVSVIYLTKKLLPELLKTQGSKILNVASMVGHYPLPYQAIYAATKAFVLSFSQAIHSELKSSDVQVSTLCPGNIRTNFIRNSGLQKLYSKTKVKDMEAEIVSGITYDQLMKGKRVIYPDKSLKWVPRLIMLFFADTLTDSQYQRRKSILDS